MKFEYYIGNFLLFLPRGASCPVNSVVVPDTNNVLLPEDNQIKARLLKIKCSFVVVSCIAVLIMGSSFKHRVVAATGGACRSTMSSAPIQNRMPARLKRGTVFVASEQLCIPSALDIIIT